MKSVSKIALIVFCSSSMLEARIFKNKEGKEIDAEIQKMGETKRC